MAVPKYYEMYRSFLKVLMDGNIHSMKEEKQQVIDDFHLTVEETAELLPSGRQAIFDNRIGWCRTYLKKAQLIESPARGQYKITESGIKTYKENEVIDNNVLRQFQSFLDFTGGEAQGNTMTEAAADHDETPQETLDRVYRELNQSLANDLLAEICEMNPYRFERLVVELLIKMGYGRLQYESHATKKSGDEGIDGIVTADKLGFDSIYIQAKRFRETPVGRPDIQKFVGALAGQGAQKGIFITTSTYTKEAISFVEKNLNYKLVLIDGTRLAELMIEYELGVSTQYTYRIKQLDSDYFSEEYY